MKPPAAPAPPPPETSHTDARVKIYFLPNLMTGANLFCGFVALTKIVQWESGAGSYNDIKVALLFILLACIFDLLDGRVARMGGAESPFGREFDSLADIISFGVAPAFLVYRVVLKDVFVDRPELGKFWNSLLNHPELGWFIASVYLLCGAFRLARFNCLAAMAGSGGGKEFLGFPIPAAAGMVSSLTLFMIWWDEKDFAQGNWRFFLPILMVFLSLMMVSEVKYPSFKKLDLRATKTFTKTLLALLFLGGAFILREKLLYWVLPLFFTAYLVYGFVRPRVSRRVRHEIEDDDEDDEASSPA
ncbi:MAG: CDP-diacylglycerol--serine O-phosphatidyltransferase [Verrucomicrobiota bacterium]|jgi:CDP-diacylglycerol--serine O-phosphatidyltransferase